MNPYRFITLHDGRKLRVRVGGASRGRPLVHLHGIPGSSAELGCHEPLLRELGIEVFAVERPGFGFSDPAERSCVADWVGDFEAVADALGLGRFGLLGFSGGGAYALAVSASLGERIERVALLGCPAPFESEELLEGMAPDVSAYWRLARGGASPLAQVLSTVATDPIGLAHALIESLPEGDQRAFESSGAGDDFLRSIAEGLRQGVGATVAELVELAAPWGVDLAAVSAPVDLWHGLCDTRVPAHHAERLAAALKNGYVFMLPGVGHGGIHERVLFRRVLERFRATPPPGGW